MILTDNQKEVTVAPEVGAALSPLCNLPLGELLNECGENLLLFPHSSSVKKAEADKKQFLLTGRCRPDGSYTLSTHNLVGFISCKGVELTIRSRFSDTGAEGGMQDHFLHYMLQKVLGVNITTLPHAQDRERLFDFLPYLFPDLLNRALRQGLYKEYRRVEHNDARLRGSIDVARHLRQNIPFMGKIAYTTREFSYDNAVTRLVRHTIEHLRLRHRHVLEANPTCCENVASIIAATPSYNKQELRQVLRQKTRQHPYYTEYAPLQQLCRSILLHETLSYGQDEEEINGILFDVAWLWEEYLAQLLEPLGFTHPNNTEESGGIHLTRTKYLRYPDFYHQTAEGPLADIVADAKYKGQVDNDDVNQVITYMYRLKALRGIYLLPMEDKENCRTLQHESRTLLGYGGTLEWLRLCIPSAAQRLSFAEFCQTMQEQEEQLRNVFNNNAADAHS